MMKTNLLKQALIISSASFLILLPACGGGKSTESQTSASSQSSDQGQANKNGDNSSQNQFKVRLAISYQEKSAKIYTQN